MIFFLRCLSAVLARLPEGAIKVIAAVVAELFLLFARRRRRTLLSNLVHAFPDRGYRWAVQTGRKSVRQMIEFGLLAAALPALNEARLRKLFWLSPASERILRERAESKRPVILLGPHLGPQEALCLFPLFFPDALPLSAIYRPLDHPVLDRWIREARERFGVKLFSRKRGLQTAIRLLKNNEWLGLLFDQNSAKNGALLTFFDRVASATELPGILASRHNADLLYAYAARRDFWRIELCFEPGPTGCARDQINFSINLWLENLLQTNEELLPSWLWAHNRWRHQRRPRFSLRQKKNLLESQNQFLERGATPRKEPFLIRLPDQLSAILEILPFLRALRRSRPDVAMTVIGPKTFLPFVQSLGLSERAIALPRRGPGYVRFLRERRREFPAAHIVLSDTHRSDFESWLIGAPHRFGIATEKRKRRLLNRRWQLPDGSVHGSGPAPVALWEAFLQSQEFDGRLDLTPFFRRPAGASGPDVSIALVCDPGADDRQWPTEHWHGLLERLLESDNEVSVKMISLVSDDVPIDLDRFPGQRISVFSERTRVADLAYELASCRIAIGTASDGLFLANAVGVPVLILAGPHQSPEPIFDAPRQLLQSKTAVGPLSDISVEAVLEAAQLEKVWA